MTDEQRQVGKVQELALGFGGSTGAFSAMGRVYGVRFDEPQARRIVDAWRRSNPWAVAFWQELENAYMSAMRHKGHEFSAGRITYVYDGQHLWYMLPSGRVLCYPYSRFEGEHLVLESLELEAPKTRLLAAKLKELKLDNVLILVEAYDEKLHLAARNLLGVSVLPVSAIDPQSLLAHEHVLATVGAVRMLEEKLA